MKRLSVRIGVAVAALFATVFALTPPVHAATILHAVYDVTGTSKLKKTGSVLNLGPTKLTADMNIDDGTFTADLPLPPVSAEFKVIGLVPVSATTEFIQEGPTTGSVDLSTGDMKSTTKITLRLSNVKVGGLPIVVGPHCQSAYPATVELAGKDGFNAVLGGPVGGTFTIPPFAHCLLQQLLINQLIPGPGNTIDLTLGPPVITAPENKKG
ncbi:hypothetical protein [Fodinicola acaciae]|uniref:hypothetical protein n=1 Tax=Fodinicola acaciae TaxID=2681555 RepID=UPI0013D6B7E4|nr:hypothetical protein [Fodinicola acaciae]